MEVNGAEDFRNPPGEFGPLVRWFWSGVVEDAALTAQIRLLVERGFSGSLIQLHPTNCLEGYSSQYLNRLGRVLSIRRRIAQEADRTGFKIWVYLTSPLLLASGRDPAERYVKIHRWDTTPGKWRKVRFSEPILHATAFQVPVDLTTFRLSHSVDVTAAVQRFETPDGLQSDESYHVIAFTQGTTESQEVACIARDWELLLGEYLGGALEGVVCPLSFPMTHAGVLPWYPEMEMAFQKDHRYELLPNLPTLVIDTGQASVRVRQDFWHTWHRECSQRTWQPIKDWCASHHLKLVAEIRSDSPHGDSLNGLLLVAGLGTVFDGWLVAPTTDSENISLPRLCSSLARQQGRSVWFDVSQGPLTLKESLARHAQEECSRWITHAVADTISLSRLDSDKQHRWFLPDEDDLSVLDVAAFHRFSSSINRSTSRKQVAVLLPSSSMWSRPVGSEDDLTLWVRQDFAALCRQLEEMHFNFDLVSEWDFIHADVSEGDVSKGTCHVGRMGYEMLILPSVTSLSRFAWAKIMDFVRHGGKAAAFGLLPRTSEIDDEEEFVKRVSADARVDVRGLYESYRAQGEGTPDIDVYPVFCEDISGGRFCSFQPRLCADPEDAALRMHQIMRESMEAEFESQIPSLHYQRRVLTAEDEIFDRHVFIISSHGHQPISSKVQLGVAGVPQRLECATGETKCLWTYSWLGDHRLSVPLDLEPADTMLIQIHEDQIGNRVESTNVEVQAVEVTPAHVAVRGYARHEGQEPFAVLETGSRSEWLQAEATAAIVTGNVDRPWSLRKSETWKPLIRWRYRKGKAAPSLLSRITSRRQAAWMDVPPDLVCNRDINLTADEVIQFRTTFSVEGPLNEVDLFAEPLPGEREYCINGQSLRMDTIHRWNQQWRHASLKGRLRRGGNEIVVLVRPQASVPWELTAAPGVIGLYGEFAYADPASETLTPLHEIHSVAERQPIPLHLLADPQPVEVASFFELEERMAGRQIIFELQLDRGSIELRINESVVQAAPFPPYRFDITHHVRTGQNNICLRLCLPDVDSFAGKPAPTVAMGATRLTAYPPVELTKELA